MHCGNGDNDMRTIYAALALLILAGCSCDSQPPPRDSGTDSGVDGGTDGGVDAQVLHPLCASAIEQRDALHCAIFDFCAPPHPCRPQDEIDLCLADLRPSTSCEQFFSVWFEGSCRTLTHACGGNKS